MQITVTYDDGRTEAVRPTPYNLVAFERLHGRPFADVEREPRIEWVLWLAWHRLGQLGQEDRDFDDFLAALGPLDQEAEPAAPFPHPSPDSSPTSP